MRVSSLIRPFRDPYVAFCSITIVVWLLAWLAAFHNIYGWLLDDEDTFYRFQIYAVGGKNFFDIHWFHAYMWFLMLPQMLFHFSVPSHVAPRAYFLTSEFRALILYTIFLHGAVLALLAWFFRRICSNRLVCGAAFLLIVTSPTLALYTPLLDSRYLSLLSVLPALILMLRESESGFVDSRWARWAFLLSGFLLGLGEDVHYECLYFSVPFAAVYWVQALWSGRRSIGRWRLFALFVVGLCAWIVPVQCLSLLFHPFGQSYIGTLLSQYSNQIPPYTRVENIAVWWKLFSSELGIPMMIAAVAGLIILLFDRLRPDYVSRFNALIIVVSAALFSAYLFESPTFPFYRMAFCYQFFYALSACIFAERAVSAIIRNAAARRVAFAAIIVGLAFIPTFLRTPAVFAAQQGLGAAVNAAYSGAGRGAVFFIDVTDSDAVPQAVISRSQFDALTKRDYLVTYFPVTFHFKYPDLFALLESIKPVARYPTLWCTREMWAQAPTFYGTRNWADEPENCDALVYRVEDIKRAALRPKLIVASVRADSSAMPSMSPKRIFARRQPSYGWYGMELWRIYWDMWVSAAKPGEHWVDIRFSKPEKLSRVTVVPPDFRVPPDFLWRGRQRDSNIAIETVGPNDRPNVVWEGRHLEGKVIINARFQPVTTSSLRVVLSQSPGPNQRVALKYVDFPEYNVMTAWDSVDQPGKPGPGK